MKNMQCVLLSAIVLAAVLVTSSPTIAASPPSEGTPKTAETAKTDSLMEANQAMNNPITNFTLFIIENGTTASNGKITDKNRYQNYTLIEPLLPVSIGDTGWNLINRPVLPVVTIAEVPSPSSSGTGLDWGLKGGLGDIVFFSLIKPPTSGNFQWGVGPTITMNTATSKDLGAGKWSAGPAAIALYTSPKLTYGALIQQWWSFAGSSHREDVSKLNLQYFLSYQFTENWGFISAPTIIADWEADSGNQWSVPISAGIAYSFKMGEIPARVLFEPQVYLVKPKDFGAEWNIRLGMAMVLPKL